MSGKLIDLSQPTVRVPSPVVVDTSVVVALLLASSLSAPVQAAQASSFFTQLLSTNRDALLTPTAFGEVVHIAIKFHYTTVLRAQGREDLSQQLGVPISSWLDLLKHDPSILQRYAGNLAALRRAIIAHNVSIIDPNQLGSIASGRSHQEELLHLVSHFGLDTNDALILMEASRLGVRSIVTMDRDLLRAQADFDIYTWH